MFASLAQFRKVEGPYYIGFPRGNRPAGEERHDGGHEEHEGLAPGARGEVSSRGMPVRCFDHGTVGAVGFWWVWRP